MKTLSLFNPRFASDIFDVFGSNFPGFDVSQRRSPMSLAMPRTDVIEDEKNYILEMELPGFSEENVNISLNDKVLTIESKYEKCEETKDKDAETENAYLIRERRERRFSRSFTMPNDIDGENISADFKDGLLTINVPRILERAPKQIAINAKKK
ncbi:MAG: Hsp20/alpha crystallin family protein [Treponema sp.]|nr:Hsp20/alpha crystallin family protein [Treponema sp.]